MSDLMLVIAGLGAVVTGVAGAVTGWQTRTHHRLITGTPTTEIRNIDSEGQVEFTGPISGPADGGEFVSPIGQMTETVVATWEVEEWDERGDYSGWRSVASGIDATPFHLGDGTAQVRVAIENWDADNVVCEWEDVPVGEEVGVDAEAPAHIRTFEYEHDIPEQSGSMTNVVDVGNKHGDRRYSERTLSPGDEIYLLGHVEAIEGATRPLHPKDVIVTQVADEPVILSDLSETALTDRFSASYRFRLVASALAFVLGAGLLVAGTTPVL